MTTEKRGVSALLLQRQLGLRRYETAWMMLHKLRRAMVNFAREPLRGEVEIDDTWVGGTQAGIRGSRQLKGRRAALVLVAVEKRGRASCQTLLGLGTLHHPTPYETIRKAKDLSKSPTLPAAADSHIGLPETTG
jgi:hypothetical protein